MLHLLQMGPSKVLTSLPLQIQNFWQLLLLELPSCCVTTCNTVTSSSDSSGFYTSTVQSSPPSAIVVFPPHPRLQTFYPSVAYFVSSPSAPCTWLSFYAPASASLPNSGFFNGMLEVFEPGALNCFTFFRPIPLTLSVARNSILTHLLFTNTWILCSAL